MTDAEWRELQAELFTVPRDWWRYRRCPVCRGVLASQHRRHEVDPVFTYLMVRQCWVKIGKSYQPEVRRKVLSMPSPGCRVVCPRRMNWSAPIALVAVLDGDVEHGLHERWADRHAAGEWFRPDGRMWRWVEQLAAGHREVIPA